MLYVSGENDHRIPSVNADLRATGAYCIVVKMLAHLILLSDGTEWVLGGISPFFKSLLEGKLVEECLDELVVEDVPDFSDRAIIKKVFRELAVKA